MDFPFLLLALLALPLVAAGLIVAVSASRRRGEAVADEPVHRLQTGTAAAQDAVVHPAAAAPKVESARQRRADSAPPQTGTSA